MPTEALERDAIGAVDIGRDGAGEGREVDDDDDVVHGTAPTLPAPTRLAD